MDKKIPKQDDLKVFITSSKFTCGECKEDLGKRAWIVLTENKKALCLSCGDLEHLMFLPSGNAALTRRSRKHSGLSAIVLKWSKTRRRYERQGILVEEQAISKAETECLADKDAREQRRIRETERRSQQDVAYIKQFANEIRQHYPKCPQKTAKSISEHACLKYSGRVGRSAFAKTLDKNAIRLAVVAHIRHAETPYDNLLMSGLKRFEARLRVEDMIQTVLKKWQ